MYLNLHKLTNKIFIYTKNINESKKELIKTYIEHGNYIHKRVMRMKIRRAAIKEYLRAATRIAKEMNKSCPRT